MDTVRIIVAGGRDFDNWDLLKSNMDELEEFFPNMNIVIVSGLARGADLMGRAYAQQLDWDVDEYPAHWDRYGKSAGYRRNTEMAAVSDALLAFWDGNSRGTCHMINTMVEQGKPVRIIRYE